MKKYEVKLLNIAKNWYYSRFINADFYEIDVSGSANFYEESKHNKSIRHLIESQANGYWVEIKLVKEKK